MERLPAALAHWYHRLITRCQVCQHTYQRRLYERHVAGHRETDLISRGSQRRIDADEGSFLIVVVGADGEAEALVGGDVAGDDKDIPGQRRQRIDQMGDNGLPTEHFQGLVADHSGALATGENGY